VDDAIARSLAVWTSGVQLAIEEFDHLETLPGQILLCGGGAGLSQIPETLATSDWYKDLPFARRPLIHIIDPEDIPGVRNTTDKRLDHTLITAMGLLRVGVDTLVGTAAAGGIRAKLAKLLRN
jgi:cell division protein FtsA